MQPYSISLLNDLHAHFPDLLYRPTRFRNVSDVLQYIIQVANQNPYERALRTHRDASPRRAIREEKEEKEEKADVYLRMEPLRIPRPTLAVPIGTESILSNFLSEMMGPSFLHPLEPFGNFNPLEPVLVHPTAEQIRVGSTVILSLRTQNDNCAICQDPIEEGQQMRMLHYCTHAFHQTCIDTWFQRHVTCPTCRHDIRDL